MLLSTRVTVIVSLVFLLGMGSLHLTAQQREELVTRAQTEATINDQRALWRKIVQAAVQAMEPLAGQLLADGRLAEAARSGNAGQLAAHLKPALDQLQDRAGRIELIGAQGRLLFDSSAVYLTNPTLDAHETDIVLKDGQPVRGLHFSAGNIYAAVLAVPVADAGGTAAVLTLTASLQAALNEVKEIGGTEAMLVNRRGRLMMTTTPTLWQAIDGEKTFRPREGMRRVTVGERTFAVTTVPVEGTLANVVAYLVTAKDVTALHRQQELLGLAALLAGLTVLGLGVLVLGRYLTASFDPLERAIAVLAALSRGDTSVTLTARRDDEIGRIAHAVERFRRHMTTLARLERAQDRQRRRQERFINREMTELASTLDTTVRSEILDDLHEVELAYGKEEAGGLGIMAEAFQKMSQRVQQQHHHLRQLVVELQEALKTKAAYYALQQELDIAREIQISILPKAFPANPLVDIHGRMLPAKEVGGDFYDFFVIDRHRIGLVVADVSGKGVPAAFFMAIARTLLKATALFGSPPGICLANLNNLLAESNEKELFVTIFYGILDTRTGRFVYANGGHNPPYLLRADSGEVATLPRTNGTALAVLEGLSYREHAVTLAAGDSVVLFTDGVTESFDPDDVEFGDPRLAEELRGCVARPSSEVTSVIFDAVAAFARGAPQSDDITCVVLRYLSNNGVLI